MAEWFKAHAWKACEEPPPQVRILFSTPLGKFLRSGKPVFRQSCVVARKFPISLKHYRV